MQKNRAKLYFQVVFATAVWGAAYPFTKHLVTEISPLSIMFFRALVGVLMLLILARPRLKPADFAPGPLWRLFIMSVLGVSAQQYLQAYALKYTLATHGGWLIASTPIMVAALAVAGGEKLGLFKAAAFAAGTAGTLLVVLSTQGTAAFSAPSTRGDVCFLVTCAAWALYVLATRKWLTAWPQAKATAATMVVALATVAPFWFVSGGLGEFARLSARGWADLAYLSVLSSGLAYLFWNNAVAGLGAVKASYFCYIEPFSTLLSAYLLLGETAAPAVFAGGLMILGGVYLLGLRESGAPRPGAVTD